ncbi:hypothetical protein EAI_08311 [Harpegnathos saltator]|uniref:Uncharacterized protein n=1 Tax=Harpegnathos saltator TaxID=610380 RepID=E2BZN0_HARSA|nr:hypothetical protein EAI_08311 [Harpegnathos saltator]
MIEDWNVCTSVSSKTQMINKAILCHRFSKCTIGAYTMNLLLFGITNIFVQKSVSFDQVDEERQLLIKMKLPFMYNTSPIYEIVMITQFLLQYTLALMAGMLNVFIVTLNVILEQIHNSVCIHIALVRIETCSEQNPYAVDTEVTETVDSDSWQIRRFISGDFHKRGANVEEAQEREIMLPTSTIDGPMGFTLRLIGIWPDCLCKNLLPILWTIVMLASQIFQYWYLFTHIGSDTLNDLAHSLSLCFSNSLLFLKLNILWWNRR